MWLCRMKWRRVSIGAETTKTTHLGLTIVSTKYVCQPPLSTGLFLTKNHDEGAPFHDILMPHIITIWRYRQ
jgi:hypothetical protein